MRKFFVTAMLILGILASASIGAMEVFAGKCEDVRGEVLRLHIPANSDSPEDQAVKLRLRDFILEKYAEELSQCGDLASAKEKTAALLPEIEEECTRFLRENGFEYGATAELVTMYFTTREYDRLVLPAGEYSALRITLGSGEGHNWWCVVFPQLCLPAVSDGDQNAEEVLDSFGKPQKIKVKFALYEWITKTIS